MNRNMCSSIAIMISQVSFFQKGDAKDTPHTLLGMTMLAVSALVLSPCDMNIKSSADLECYLPTDPRLIACIWDIAASLQVRIPQGSHDDLPDLSRDILGEVCCKIHG